MPTGEIYNITYLRQTVDGEPQLHTWWGRYLDGTNAATAVGDRPSGLRARMDAAPSRSARDADRRGAVPAGQPDRRPARSLTE